MDGSCRFDRNAFFICAVPEDAQDEGLMAVFAKYSPSEVRIISRASQPDRISAVIRFETDKQRITACDENQIVRLMGHSGRVFLTKSSPVPSQWTPLTGPRWTRKAKRGNIK
jgi:hypothetical protein